MVGATVNNGGSPGRVFGAGGIQSQARAASGCVHAANREISMGEKKPSEATADTGKKTYICYGCGKKISTPEEIVENERAQYCETCYRDRFFYHTTNGGKNLERM